MWQWLAALAAIGGAGAAQLLTQVSSPRNDYNLSYDRSERIFVFARSDADFANAKIYVAERRGARWSQARPIAFSDPRFSDSDPWLTPDGSTLYFASTRPTAARPDKKDLDLWRSRRGRGGEWSAPEHLGEAINGAGPELGPELHGGTLYFSAARKSGKGGLDIYTARESGGTFGAPALLAGPFNTATSESDFTLSPDGRRAAFWRMVGDKGILHMARRSGTGWSDPVPLPDRVNIGPFNFTPSFGRDSSTLRFASTRPRAGQASGLADIYVVKLGRMPN
jgi:Tol biopolymer transport system component